MRPGEPPVKPQDHLIPPHWVQPSLLTKGGTQSQFWPRCAASDAMHHEKMVNDPPALQVSLPEPLYRDVAGCVSLQPPASPGSLLCHQPCGQNKASTVGQGACKIQPLWVICSLWEVKPHKTCFKHKGTLCAMGGWRGASNALSCVQTEAAGPRQGVTGRVTQGCAEYHQYLARLHS